MTTTWNGKQSEWAKIVECKENETKNAKRQNFYPWMSLILSIYLYTIGQLPVLAQYKVDNVTHRPLTHPRRMWNASLANLNPVSLLLDNYNTLRTWIYCIVWSRFVSMCAVVRLHVYLKEFRWVNFGAVMHSHDCQVLDVSGSSLCS